MDPITHGITGALIGKAFFAGNVHVSAILSHWTRGPKTQPEGLSSASIPAGTPNPLLVDAERAAGTARVAIRVCAVAAMFPDVDIAFEPFVRREMAMLELHRGVTHSLACLPLFVAALATLTWWWLSRKETRISWWKLAVIWAAGMLSHIVLDAATSWGTMLWAPASNARAAWDWVFIIDFPLTGIVLLPQVAAWVYARREGVLRRAIAMWAVFSAVAAAVGALASALDVPLSPWAILAAVVALAALFFWRAVKAAGGGVDRFGPFGFAQSGGLSYKSRAEWCRAGVIALAGYLALCAFAHQRALAEVERFAQARGLRADAIGALPMPPAATRWLGLVRTPDGSWRSYFNVAGDTPPQFEFIADGHPPERIARSVDALAEVRTYRWFARFPVLLYREERGRHVVELVDLRFYPRTASTPVPFQYRVVLNDRGEVIEQGWVED